MITASDLKGADELSDGNKTQEGRDQGALTADVKHIGAAPSRVYHSQTYAFFRHLASIKNEQWTSPSLSLLASRGESSSPSMAMCYSRPSRVLEGEVG